MRKVQFDLYSVQCLLDLAQGLRDVTEELGGLRTLRADDLLICLQVESNQFDVG